MGRTENEETLEIFYNILYFALLFLFCKTIYQCFSSKKCQVHGSPLWFRCQMSRGDAGQRSLRPVPVLRCRAVPGTRRWSSPADHGRQLPPLHAGRPTRGSTAPPAALKARPTGALTPPRPITNSNSGALREGRAGGHGRPALVLQLRPRRAGRLETAAARAGRYLLRPVGGPRSPVDQLTWAGHLPDHWSRYRRWHYSRSCDHLATSRVADLSFRFVSPLRTE